MNPNFYVENYANPDNYVKYYSNPNFYVEINADDDCDMSKSLPSLMNMIPSDLSTPRPEDFTMEPADLSSSNWARTETAQSSSIHRHQYRSTSLLKSLPAGSQLLLHKQRDAPSQNTTSLDMRNELQSTEITNTMERTGHSTQNYSSNTGSSIRHVANENLPFKMNKFENMHVTRGEQMGSGWPINHVVSANTNITPTSNSSDGVVKNQAYYDRRARNNNLSKVSRLNRRKRTMETELKLAEAEQLNRQLNDELDATYDELAEVMYLIALAKGEVVPEEDDLTDSEE